MISGQVIVRVLTAPPTNPAGATVKSGTPTVVVHSYMNAEVSSSPMLPQTRLPSASSAANAMLEEPGSNGITTVQTVARPFSSASTASGVSSVTTGILFSYLVLCANTTLTGSENVRVTTLSVAFSITEP